MSETNPKQSPVRSVLENHVADVRTRGPRGSSRVRRGSPQAGLHLLGAPLAQGLAAALAELGDGPCAERESVAELSGLGVESHLPHNSYRLGAEELVFNEIG